MALPSISMFPGLGFPTPDCHSRTPVIAVFYVDRTSAIYIKMYSPNSRSAQAISDF